MIKSLICRFKGSCSRLKGSCSRSKAQNIYNIVWRKTIPVEEAEAGYSGTARCAYFLPRHP